MRGDTKWGMQILHMANLVLNRQIKPATSKEPTMTEHQSSLRFLGTEQIVRAYSGLIRDKMDEGRDAYFLNFMFNQLPGSRRTRMGVMTQEVERVHSILTHHIVRRPEAENWAHFRPIFIGSHDLPVFKWDRGELHRLDVVNDGLHFNVIALVPPHSHPGLPAWFQYGLWGRQSRLKVPLDQHFREGRKFYLNDQVARIHVTPVKYGTMADYTLKAFKHGRVDSDSILILN
jgi:hypothetical protein